MRRIEIIVRIGVTALLLLTTAVSDVFAQFGKEGDVKEEILRREMPERIAEMKIPDVIRLLDLKPGGSIVIIDKPTADDWMWMRRSDVNTWMAGIGFYPVDDFNLYKGKYFVVYQRPYPPSRLLDKTKATASTKVKAVKPASKDQ